MENNESNDSSMNSSKSVGLHKDVKDDNPANAMVNGTPFSELLGRAVKIKTAQTASLREKYEAYPRYYQNSLFPKEEVLQARRECLSFMERMNIAKQMKEVGNKAFQQKNFDEAMSKYEMAAGVFKYIENTNPNIRNEGIKDEFISELNYTTDNANQNEEIHQFLMTCYCNIALVCLQKKEFKYALEACNEVVDQNPHHGKALYLRARSRVSPASAGATEYELALKDLILAHEYCPDDQIIIKTNKRIRDELNQQRINDKKMFGNLFSKSHTTEIYPTKELEKEREWIKKVKEDQQKNHMTLHDAKQVADWYEKNGMYDKEKKLRDEITKIDLAHKVKVEERMKKDLKNSFRNPTAEMKVEAKQHGVDLEDSKVISLLETMHDDHDQNSRSENMNIDSLAKDKISHQEEREKMLENLVSEMSHSDVKYALKSLSIPCSFFQSGTRLKERLLQAILDSDENVEKMISTYLSPPPRMSKFRVLGAKFIVMFPLFYIWFQLYSRTVIWLRGIQNEDTGLKDYTNTFDINDEFEF